MTPLAPRNSISAHAIPLLLRNSIAPPEFAPEQALYRAFASWLCIAAVHGEAVNASYGSIAGTPAVAVGWLLEQR